MGFIHIQRQLQDVFEKQLALVSNGFSLRLTILDDDHMVIRVSAIRYTWQPLSIFMRGNWSLALDIIVPVPTVLAGFIAQAFCYQPLIELIEHDI